RLRDLTKSLARQDLNRSVQVTTATPVPKGTLDFMHGWATNRHERYVSTMLTESDLSIALLVRPFQASGRCNWRCKTTSTVARCAFRLDVSRKSAPHSGTARMDMERNEKCDPLRNPSESQISEGAKASLRDRSKAALARSKLRERPSTTADPCSRTRSPVRADNDVRRDAAHTWVRIPL